MSEQGVERASLSDAEKKAVAIAVGKPGTRIYAQACEAVLSILAARQEDLERRMEAWIRHGEAVPSAVTTYDRWIVHDELRHMVTRATQPTLPAEQQDTTGRGAGQ